LARSERRSSKLTPGAALLIALARGRPWGVVESRGAAPAAASLYAQRARAAIISELGSGPHGAAFA
jgi:hypothetical protein